MMSAARNPRRGRRVRAVGGVVAMTLALAALLTACAAGSSSGSGSSRGAPGATATTSATSDASATVTASASATPAASALATASHLSLTDSARVCGGAFRSSAGPAYLFGQHVVAEPGFALSYPSYALPAGLARKPYDLGDNSASSAFDARFGGPANANPAIAQPGGIILTICDNGPTATKITGAGVGVMSYAPHASPIDTWQICDGAYQPGVGVTLGGCGGAVLADEDMRATFPSGAGAGATTSAAMLSASGANGYGPLPVTIQPGQTLTITLAITMPSAPGTYTLGLTLSGPDIPSAQYAPLAPQLFAPVAHQWNGQNCKAPTMLSQIPTSATSSYFICP